MLTAIEILNAFQIGVFAFVFSCILIRQDYILEFYFDFLVWLESKTSSKITKPLGLCESCLAGQIALWFEILTAEKWYKIEIINAIIFVSFSIFFAAFLAAVFKKINR